MPKKIPEKGAAEVARLAKRPGLHAVGGVAGLCLQVSPTGGKSWLYRSTIRGRRRSIGLGPYPETPLAEARASARRLWQQIRDGGDPLAEREQQPTGITFADAARAVHAKKAHEFRNAKHRHTWLSSLELHAFPHIGDHDVADIDVHDVEAVIRPMWHTKTETASRVRQRIESVLNWAQVKGYTEGPNPAAWAGNLAEVMPKPAAVQSSSSYPRVSWREADRFMTALRRRDSMAARCLELIALTATRSLEARGARWDEINLEAALWTVPAERTKVGRPHRVPLSADAVALLRSLPRMQGSPYVFPGHREGQPLSDTSVRHVIVKRDGRGLAPEDEAAGGPGFRDPDDGRRTSVHGLRSTFKEWATNCTTFADEVSELQLAHVNSDATRAAYQRDGLIDQRRQLVEQWAAYLRGDEAGTEAA